MSITQLQEIRRDGQIIDESMSPADIAALGEADIITEIRWRHGDQQVSLQNGHGLLAHVVPCREFIAVSGQEAPGAARAVTIMNADGSWHLFMPGFQVINGEIAPGEYGKFEAARDQAPSHFGVLYRRSADGMTFHLDIDASSGRTLGMAPMQDAG